ncbi:Ger(x)C family spore germination protein [Alkalihalobacterium chitinilyticum]|uniref:Ger(X)C family spore germination protein n=1 Tax=Alkalihalobacterium chitinilyticum TaxID=2980103 RepID=A0ABT5VD47_9BACI|nr:Ger(x)C family spore germination protein [Alkalihalobacterium chitinilyticum]MDE5413381.1 Ger(x)C family spore germination protein [Alkalihalobacterium chitinilyticum]
MKKFIYFTFLTLLVTCLIGCWDLTEIEEIGFVVGIGLDPTENEERKLRMYERERGHRISPKAEHPQLFDATFNVSVPSKIEAQEGGRTGRAFFNITTTDLTNFNSIRQVSARRSRRLNFEHLKVLIINESLVKSGPMLKHLVDLYIRDHEMRRKSYVYITSANTKDILNVKLPLEELITTSIVDITDNYEANLAMPSPTTMGDIATHITGEKSFIIPQIKPVGNDLRITGAAVFLGTESTMRGWLTEEEVKGYNWVIGDAESVIIEAEYEEGQGEFFVYEVITMASTIDYRRENNRNIFDIKVKAEGSFAESWLHDVDISNEQTIRELEELIEKAIVRQVKNSIEKVQNDFQADIFGFHNKVRQQQYPYWKTIKEHWEGEGGEFQHAEVNVSAAVKIRHYMLNERLD